MTIVLLLLQWYLSWETTAMRDHHIFLTEGPTFQFTWTCHQRPPVLKDRICFVQWGGLSKRTTATVIPFQRSRHGSGASVRSRRSDSQEGGGSGQRRKPTDSPDVTSTSHPQEEAWHTEMRNNFLNSYLQYLQCQGFLKIRYMSQRKM